MDQPDPFAHHPDLRPLIKPPERSFFRDLDLAALDERLRENGVPPDWRRPDDAREAARRAVLEGHTGDLWVFGYGSLMWDPAILFAEVRYARLPGYARSMCLLDVIGGRGNKEVPGLMAALDIGDYCDGLAFRIAADLVEAESERLCRREMLGPAYIPRFVDITFSDGAARALTFVADHNAPQIRPDLSHEEQVRAITSGAGFLGTSMEYLENLAEHLDTLGLIDPHITRLLDDARAALKA